MILGIFLVAPLAVSADLTCAGTPRASRDAESVTNRKMLEPPQTNQPTMVDISIYLTNLTDIDTINSRFRFEAYAEFGWCDPREAFDADATGTDIRRILGEQLKDSPFWTPDLSIANGIGDVQVTESLTEIHSDGRIRARGYFNSAVTAPFDLQHFPFDKQIFKIQIESFSFSRDDVELRWLVDNNGFHDDIFLPEWRIDSVDTRIEQTIEIRNRAPFSRAIFAINVSREYGYYIYKLSVPLLLIVCLSWTVFWMRNESLASRMRDSATAFLTIVAYQFAISNDLPKVAYLTILDRLMITSFILIALTALENMFVVYILRENQVRAEMVDRVSRWAFPLVYGTVITMIALLYSL